MSYGSLKTVSFEYLNNYGNVKATKIYSFHFTLILNSTLLKFIQVKLNINVSKYKAA